MCLIIETAKEKYLTPSSGPLLVKFAPQSVNSLTLRSLPTLQQEAQGRRQQISDAAGVKHGQAIPAQLLAEATAKGGI